MGAEARLRGSVWSRSQGRVGAAAPGAPPAHPLPDCAELTGAAAPGPFAKSRGLGRNRLWRRGLAQRGGQPSRTGKVPSGEAGGVGVEPAEWLAEGYQASEGRRRVVPGCGERAALRRKVGRETEAAPWGPRRQAAVVQQVVSASRTLPSSGIPPGTKARLDFGLRLLRM